MSKKTQALARKDNIPETARQTSVLVAPKNEEQRAMIKTVAENTITFVCGAPGSGKTYLAVAFAIQQLFRDKFQRIVFTRPVIEAAGEKLGYLPGDVHEKIDPYMMPIYNSLAKLVDEELLQKLIHKNGKAAVINIMALAHMRGMTFENSVVICDEAQNSTPEQIRMLITRIGEGTKMIICGDLNQSDIRNKNGLEDAFDLLNGIPSIGFVTMSEESIVRNPIIKAIEERYQKRAQLERDRRRL
jgi:phosphate starvation-inducible PhoH-like protein